MDLTEFLTTRLDEDEESARDAYYDGQVWVPEEEAVVAADRDLDPVLFLDRKRDAEHAANWSPARVLAQVAAMRAIVDEHRHTGYDYSDGRRFSFICSTCGSGEIHEYPRPWPCRTVRHLATIWSSHPDYDPAWAPTAA